MSRHLTHRRTLLALLPAGLLAACAAPFAGPPPPRVRIVDLRPLDATMFEQRYRAPAARNDFMETFGEWLQIQTESAAGLDRPFLRKFML